MQRVIVRQTRRVHYMDESLSSPPGTLGVMPLGVVEGLQEMGEEERDQEEEEGPHASAQSNADASAPGPSKAAAKKDPPAPPFKVGEGLPAVPPRLVAKIQRGEYVDMAELLRDNIEADRRRSLQGSAAAVCSLISGKAGGRREIPDIMSWVQCFGTYACVLSDKFPHLVRQLWAYQTLMVREARRCSGQGWRDYDAMFRQQAGSAEELEWDKLNSSLYAVTFLAQTGRGGRPCRWCQEVDHLSSECALVPDTQLESKTPPARESRPWRPKSERICFSWNRGNCRFEPYCRFRHVCSVKGCQGDHRATDCRLPQSKPPAESSPRRDGSDRQTRQ